MKLIKIGHIEFKRIIKNKLDIIILLAIPMTVMMGLSFFLSDKPTKNNMLLVNEDREILGEKFKEKLISEEVANIKIKDREEASELIGKGYYDIAYVIPQDFSKLLEEKKVPQIETLKKSNTNNTFALDNKILGLLKNFSLSYKLQEDKLDNRAFEEGESIAVVTQKKDNSNIPIKTFLMITILLNLAMYSSINVCTELIDLKRQKIFTRNLSTPNKSSHIVVGVLLGLLMLQGLCYLIIIGTQKYLLGMSIDTNILTYFVNILSIALVSMCLGVMVSRFTNNESIGTMIINIFATATGFLSGTFVPEFLLPEVLRGFAKITPQYWAFKGITEGSIFPNILVPLLFAALFVTAGTFKFVNQKSA